MQTTFLNADIIFAYSDFWHININLL